MRFASMFWWLAVPLLYVPAVSQDPIPDAATLQREFDVAQRDWNLKNRAAQTANDTEELARLSATRPEAVFTKQFAAAAKSFEGREEAVPYLAWLVSRGSGAIAKTAMTTLMDSHVASSGVRLAVARIGGLKQEFGVEQSRAWLDLVLEKNKDAQVLTQAHFTRAAMYVGTRAVATSVELRDLAIEDLRAATKILADSETDSASLRGLVDSLLDEALRLEPGLVAPDIEGNDLLGVPFKLSDYRGKVVLLDFWGDW